MSKRPFISLLSCLILLLAGCGKPELVPTMSVREGDGVIPIIYTPDPTFHNNNHRIPKEAHAYLYTETLEIEVIAFRKGDIEVSVEASDGTQILTRVFRPGRLSHYMFAAPVSPVVYTLSLSGNGWNHCGSFSIPE